MRRLRDVRVGETVYSWSPAMCIDRERSCFLDPEAWVSSEDLRSLLTALKITRGEEGWDVCILRRDAVWQPSKVPGDYYPVRTLAESASD